jgi:hypothetical protein
MMSVIGMFQQLVRTIRRFPERSGLETAPSGRTSRLSSGFVQRSLACHEGRVIEAVRLRTDIRAWKRRSKARPRGGPNLPDFYSRT